MSTIADLSVKQIEDHLIAGGFLAAFTDILGSAQPAPIFQPFELDLTDMPPTSRVVMIRETGTVNSANRFLTKEQPMLIVVVGRANVNDLIIVKGLANDMEIYLNDNFGDGGCLYNINTSGVTGSFILPDGRRAFEINIVAFFNI
jgi:hypothetical protein